MPLHPCFRAAPVWRLGLLTLLSTAAALGGTASHAQPASAPIEVRKVGLERWLYRLALEQPFIYGIMSLAIAISAGWGASAAFRVFKRA